jgi:diguanylate cyclase
MPSPSNPSEIARETLRLLASRRISPSPENYRDIYNEIAGTSGNLAENFPKRELQALQTALPKETAVQQKLVKRFEQALKGRNWDELRDGIAELVKQLANEHELPWSDLFRDFLRQWENKQAGLTVARKREAIERVLVAAAGNSELLFGRLQGLVKSWAGSAPADGDIPLVDPGTIAMPEASLPLVGDIVADSATRTSELSSDLRDLFAYTLRRSSRHNSWMNRSLPPMPACWRTKFAAPLPLPRCKACWLASSALHSVWRSWPKTVPNCARACSIYCNC